MEDIVEVEEWEMESRPLLIDHFAGPVGLEEPMHEQEFSSPVNDILRSLRPEAPVECRESPERLYGRHERAMVNLHTPLSKLTVPSPVRKLGPDKKLEHYLDTRIPSIPENREGPCHIAGNTRLPEKRIGLGTGLAFRRPRLVLGHCSIEKILATGSNRCMARANSQLAQKDDIPNRRTPLRPVAILRKGPVPFRILLRQQTDHWTPASNLALSS